MISYKTKVSRWNLGNKQNELKNKTETLEQYHIFFLPNSLILLNTDTETIEKK